MCHRNPTGTPFLQRNPPPFLARKGHRNPTGTPLLVQEDPSWTLPGPLPAQEPPPFLHKNPLPVPLPRHFLHRNPPPSCTWCFPSQTVWSSRTLLSHWGIATTHAMQLRPGLATLGISVVPPRVKLCEAPRSWLSTFLRAGLLLHV